MTFDDIEVIFEEFIKLRHDLPASEKSILEELNETAGDLVHMLHDDTDPEFDSSNDLKSIETLVKEFEKKFKRDGLMTVISSSWKGKLS